VRQLALLIAVMMGAAPARAGFIISINNTTVPRGGTGTVDVFLSSTAGPLSPDQVNNIGFTMQISGPQELQFASTQGFGYLNDPHYIFAGDSTDQGTGSPGGSVSTIVYANDTFIGSDSTASGNPVSLSTSSGQVLLATLSLDAAITNVGDSYTIGLVPTFGNGSIDSSPSTHLDVFDFLTGAEASAVPFTSTPGTVTITGSSVPEPPAIASVLTAGMILSGIFGVRHRGAATARLRRSIGR
jgi:hypothetical protein